jgi:hypothetical protein
MCGLDVYVMLKGWRVAEAMAEVDLHRKLVKMSQYVLVECGCGQSCTSKASQARANKPMGARRLESPHLKILTSGEKWQHSSERAGDGDKESQRRPSSLLCLLPKPTILDQNHVSPRSCACPRASTFCEPLGLLDSTAPLPHRPFAGKERVVAREGSAIDTRIPGRSTSAITDSTFIATIARHSREWVDPSLDRSLSAHSSLQMSNYTQDQGMTISGGGYESRSSAVFAVTVATCSTVFVFARLASRAGIVKKVLLDDYFILAAWVSFAYLGLLRGPLLITTLQSCSPLACHFPSATAPSSASVDMKTMCSIHGRARSGDHNTPSPFYTTLH